MGERCHFLYILSARILNGIKRDFKVADRYSLYDFQKETIE